MHNQAVETVAWQTSSSSCTSVEGPLWASWNKIFFILRYCRLSSSRTASLVRLIRSIRTDSGRSRCTNACWRKDTDNSLVKKAKCYVAFQHWSQRTHSHFWVLPLRAPQSWAYPGEFSEGKNLQSFGNNPSCSWVMKWRFSLECGHTWHRALQLHTICSLLYSPFTRLQCGALILCYMV